MCIYEIRVACTFQTLAETDGNIMHLYASSAMISATSSWADGCWFCSVLRLGMIYRAIQRRAFLGSKVISKDYPRLINNYADPCAGSLRWYFLLISSLVCHFSHCLGTL